ncbi:Nuclear distribution protein PAC1 [Cytospora mali]|uniref:Nuclear distribution protein PAC1 n=1 Tax=Cytospora mali TaxID=578113 RepID=A0A194V212_CYTMA|nr:Nuclear distribution protein PAC1 [Valsa mali var. pyri (nom. inval.)]
MAQRLTDRQAEELHKSLIAYLTANDLADTAAALREELQLDEHALNIETLRKYESLLPKKWTSVVRLQRKIMELEAREAALKAKLENLTPASSLRQTDNPTSWLPGAVPRHTLESHRTTINCLAFHPIFSSVATGSDDCTIKIWDWDVGELERTIKGHTRPVLGVDYGGPRGNVLLASCSSDLTIKLWDPSNDYQNIRTLQGHDHSVSAVCFIPSGGSSGNLLVSASRDKTLKIWDANTGFCMMTLQGHAEWVRDVTPSYDGRFLLSAGDDMTARLWDISGPRPETRLTLIGHEHFIGCCALAPPSSYQYLAKLAGLKKPPPSTSSAEFMATGSRDKTIKLWDSRGNCLVTLRGHDNWVTAVAFHPGGKFLLSVSDDKTLRCWDLSQEGKCVKVLGDSHERFISCLKWAPGIKKDVSTSSENGGNGAAGGTSNDTQVRRVVATGGVDCKLRVFAG